MLQPPQAPLPADSGTTPHVRAASRGTSRLPNVIAIAIAVVALAVAAGAWFRPLPKPEPPAAKTYSEQEVAEAKKAVCEAFTKARQAVNAAGSFNGDGQTASTFAVAVNVRLALEASSRYLSNAARQHHFAPTDLVRKIDTLATEYQQIAIDQLGGEPHDTIEPRYQAADEAIYTIELACK